MRDGSDLNSVEALALQEFFLKAPPLFLSESDGPMDTVVVNGSYATFSCSPRADPPATVKWFRNGVLLNGWIFAYVSSMVSMFLPVCFVVHHQFVSIVC